MSPLQGNSAGQSNQCPVKTRRMRNNLPSQSPTTQISPPQSMQPNQCKYHIQTVVYPSWWGYIFFYCKVGWGSWKVSERNTTFYKNLFASWM